MQTNYKNPPHAERSRRLAIFIICLFTGCALFNPQRTALISYEPIFQTVASDSIKFTQDGQHVIIWVPDNYRLHRGPWIFNIHNRTVEVCSLTVWQYKHSTPPDAERSRSALIPLIEIED